MGLHSTSLGGELFSFCSLSPRNSTIIAAMTFSDHVYIVLQLLGLIVVEAGLFARYEMFGDRDASREFSTRKELTLFAVVVAIAFYISMFSYLALNGHLTGYAFVDLGIRLVRFVCLDNPLLSLIVLAGTAGLTITAMSAVISNRMGQAGAIRVGQ